MTQLLILAEAWEQSNRGDIGPFAGSGGYLLRQLSAQMGIETRAAHLTSVFNCLPQPTPDIKNLCGTKAEGITGLKPVASGQYIRKEHAHHLSRLWDEINAVKPNLILAVGATAMWAVCRGAPSIKKYRGTTLHSHVGNIKVLPTYDTRSVQQQWSLRPIVLADLGKAKVEMEFPEIRRPHREIWIEPTAADIEEFYLKYIKYSHDLSVDIETARDQITCIGFAPTIDRALVIPFYDRTQEDGNYWRTFAEEKMAWGWVRKLCELKRARYVGQNFNYDMHFLWRRYKIGCANATDDTMLLHHALQPEMEKGLGFLGSIYTAEPAWKIMGRDKSTVKPEDE